MVRVSKGGEHNAYQRTRVSASGFLRVLNAPQAATQDLVVRHSGDVDTVTSREIVLMYDGKPHEFQINNSTKICVGGLRADSWRELVGAEVAVVVTDLDSNIALEIYDGPMEFAFTLSGVRPITPECKPKRQTVRSDLVREVQQHLKRLGYDVGHVDGLIGPRTRNAITNFERDHSYPETGSVTEEMLKRLQSAPAR